MKYAVIDIGSNSVRLMLWANGTLYKKVNTTRLAEGLSCSGSLSDAAMERTARAVSEFCEEGRREGAQVLAFATAAVRSSSNGEVFCARVKALCGLDVDVISGEEEALLGLSGAIGTGDGGIIDIGGASTEVCIRERGIVRTSLSLPVGAVRILDLCGQSIGRIDAFVTDAVRPLRGISCGDGKMYAIGGTASTLASMCLCLSEYDASKLSGAELSLEWVKAAALRLIMTPTEERKKICGMDPRRADVIAGATVLLMKIMETLRLPAVYFSDADNLEGYLAVRGLS